MWWRLRRHGWRAGHSGGDPGVHGTGIDCEVTELGIEWKGRWGERALGVRLSGEVSVGAPRDQTVQAMGIWRRTVIVVETV